MTGFVVSVPWVAPATLPAVRAWCDRIDRRGVPLSLLVVPGPWLGRPLSDDASTVAWLRDRVAGGDEVVLHGWAHRMSPLGPRWRRGLGRVAAGGAAEFAALPEPEAYGLISAGLAVLERLGLDVSGFAPPAGLVSPGTRRALLRTGLTYRLTGRAVHHLRTSARLPLARRGGTVRIAVHPAAASRPGASLSAIDMALAAGLTPLTYERLVDVSWRKASRPLPTGLTGPIGPPAGPALAVASANGHTPG